MTYLKQSCLADARKATLSELSAINRFACDARNLNNASRSDLAAIARSYIDPLRPFFSAACARVGLAGAGVSYELDTASFEAFARPLWGLAPLWAGGDELYEYASMYRSGLVAGSDPTHPEYWGDCRDYDQKFVEMAAISYALMLAPSVLWEPLPEDARERLAAWLDQINAHEVWDNNWLFFPVLVNLALRTLGMPWDADVMNRALEGIDACYCGSGWYTDGPADGTNANMDYYNPFAYHFYGLIYAVYARDYDPERVHRFVERANAFEPDFRRWFSDRGEGMAYGRSLTYRFAQSAFYSMALFALSRGLPVNIDPVIAKSIVARNIAAWASLPCTDGAGVLQVGFHYPNLHMAEGYNAPGSPMWSLKAFAALAVPGNDRIWSERLTPLAVKDGVYSSANGAMLVRHAGGESTLYTGGRTRPRRFTHCEEKYGKFAYSTRWGFSVSVSPYSLKEAAPDSMLAFEIDGMIRVRSQSESSEVRNGVLTSVWYPCKGIRVTTEIRPHMGGHTRTHIVESDFSCFAYDCGFAIPAESIEAAEGIGAVSPAKAGDSAEGEPYSFKTEPNTNLMSPKTVIHAVRYVIPAGTTRLVTEVCES